MFKLLLIFGSDSFSKISVDVPFKSEYITFHIKEGRVKKFRR